MFEYFKLISKGDIRNLLNLFTDDCIIYEPFSKLEELKGKSAIEPFFEVATMISPGMHHDIEFEFEKPVLHDKFNKDCINKVNSHLGEVDGSDGLRVVVSAIVTFHKGDQDKGRFKFEIVSGNDKTTSAKRIKRIDIQSIE